MELPGPLFKPKPKMKQIIPEKKFVIISKKFYLENFLYPRRETDLPYYLNLSDKYFYTSLKAPMLFKKVSYTPG